MVENHDYAWEIADETGPTAFGTCSDLDDALNEGYRYLLGYMESEPAEAFSLQIWHASNPRDILIRVVHFP
jgi:hypothetical protein